MSSKSLGMTVNDRMNVTTYEIFLHSFKMTENGSFAELVDGKLLQSSFFYSPNKSNFDEIRENHRLFKMLDQEVFQVLTISLLTLARGYLNEILEKFILESHQHGILEYLRHQTFRFEEMRFRFSSDPKVLTMYMLSAGFSLWLGSVFFAFIVFFGEVLTFQINSYFDL